MSHHDNRIVVDLNKVQWARFGYKNQYGQWRDTLPSTHTVRNDPFNENDKLFMDNATTMIEYARKFNLLDRWTPHVCLKVTANCMLWYDGVKAVNIWK